MVTLILLMFIFSVPLSRNNIPKVLGWRGSDRGNRAMDPGRKQDYRLIGAILTGLVA